MLGFSISFPSGHFIQKSPVFVQIGKLCTPFSTLPPAEIISASVIHAGMLVIGDAGTQFFFASILAWRAGEMTGAPTCFACLSSTVPPTTPD
jgi:hypothetical protein